MPAASPAGGGGSTPPDVAHPAKKRPRNSTQQAKRKSRVRAEEAAQGRPNTRPGALERLSPDQADKRFRHTRARVTDLEAQNDELPREQTTSDELIDAMQDGITILDERGVHLRVNPAFCRMTGWTREELVGTGPPHLYWPPEALDEIEPVFRQTLRGEFRDLELTFMRRNGERFPVIVSPSSARDRHDHVRYFATVKDITGRRQTEAALRESEDRFRLAMDATNDGLWDWNIETGQRDFNPAYSRMLGYEPDEFKQIAESWTELLHPADRDRVLAVNRECIEGVRENFEMEYRFISRDGSWKWVLGRGKAVGRDARGRARRMVGTNVDITDRKRAESRLAQALEWHRTIFEGSRDAIFLSDTGSRFTAVNSAACDLTGYSRDELLAMRIPDLHEGIDLRAYQASHDRIFAGEEIVSEAKILRNDGTKVDAEFNNRCVVVDGTSYMHTVARDVSTRKRAEDALRESELKFRTLAETTGVGILIVQDERFVYANPTAERMSGYNVGELAGVKFWELVHPDYRDLVRWQAAARRAGARDVPTSYEIKAVGKDGVARWFSLTAGATTLGGRPAIVVSLNDIDEGHRLRDLRAALYEISEATQSTRNLDELFRSIHAIVGRLMEARSFYIALYDSATNLLSFPYFVDEMDARPDPYPAERGLTSHVVHTGRPLLTTPEILRDFEERHEIRPLGTRFVDWLGVPLTVKDTVIGALVVQSYSGEIRYTEAEKEVLVYVSAQVAQAIARKRAEDELRRSEARFRSYFELPLHGIAISSTDKRWIQVNDRLCSILGYSRDELLKMSWAETTHPGDLEANVRLFDRLLAGEIDHYALEKRFIRKDGSVIWTSLSVGCVRKPDGGVDYLVVLVEDASEGKAAEDALRQSERRLATILENVQDAYFRADLDGRLVMVSPSAARMYGYASPEEMIGLAARDLYADSAERRSVFEELRKGGAVHDRVGKGRRKDGTVFWVSLNTQFYADRQGRVLGSEGFVRDITERKRADDLRAAIHEISEATQQAAGLDDLFVAVHRVVGRLMNAKNLYIALHDPTTDLISFPYFVDEVDTTPEPFRLGPGMTSYVIRTGRPLLATPGVLSELEARGEILRLGGDSIDWLGVPLEVQDKIIGVLAVQSYSGSVRYSEADKEVLSYVSRQVALAIARKRTEEALRESEARFRQSIEAFSDGFVLVDEDGNVIEWNAALERIHGITRAKALGKPLWDVEWLVYLPERRTPERYEFQKRSIQDAVRTGRFPSIPGQVDILSVDGRRRTVSQSVFGMRTEKGFRVGVVIRDITERIELEGQLRQAQKMEAVGNLAGGVAHDFNNLLQALLSQTQLLQAYARDPERVKALGLELGRQVNHGASLTRQLLLFSRRETTRPEHLDLNETVRAATKMLRRLVRANIALEIDLAPEALPVSADRGQLDQVLVNLTVNASDAMPEGGTLTIRTGALGAEHVWLSVQDSGAGIPEAIRDRIFEPFFTTKGAGKGTGLGLSVVHGIVTRHGGRIEVESMEGRGTTFTVILPKVASGEFGAAKAVSEAVPDTLSELPAGKGERVLVVEDEDAAREGLRDILRGLGYEVVAAASGEEAGMLPAEAPFDVLLTDLMLPGISGSQLAAGLQERWPALKVILMSGYTEDEAVRTGVGEGAIRFLQKPFDMARLAHELREALEEVPGPEMPL